MSTSQVTTIAAASTSGTTGREAQHRLYTPAGGGTPSTGGTASGGCSGRLTAGGVSLAGSVASRVSQHSRQALCQQAGQQQQRQRRGSSSSSVIKIDQEGLIAVPNNINRAFGSSHSQHSSRSTPQNGYTLSRQPKKHSSKGFGSISSASLLRRSGSLHSLSVSQLGSVSTKRALQANYVHVDMAISNFHIEFEVPGAQYKPGDELSGKVIMDVWASIDIKHVEFNVAGKGTLRMFQNASTFIERPKHEVYIEKHIVLIGSSTSKRGITLDPGRYVTNFQYTLPDRLPPSVHQFDMGNGYIFDISYSVQARVCDFAHSRGQAGSKLRVVKVTKKSFIVIPQQDWHSIPGALEPTVHSDQLILFCGAGGKDPTTVIVTMDRGIYPVGDNIRLTTEVISPGKDAIKDITAELEQQLFFDSDLIKKFRRVMIKAFDDGRNRKITRNGATMKSTFGISLPTNIIPSYIPHCKMVDLQYTMKVKVRFKKFGGKLVIRLPVIIAPASDSDRKDGELPLFNKPVMQFPYFSKSPFGNGHSNNGYQHSSTASDESTRDTLRRVTVPRGTTHNENNVTTKYKTALNCCGCCLLCLGFGILDS